MDLAVSVQAGQDLSPLAVNKPFDEGSEVVVVPSSPV